MGCNCKESNEKAIKAFRERKEKELLQKPEEEIHIFVVDQDGIEGVDFTIQDGQKTFIPKSN